MIKAVDCDYMGLCPVTGKYIVREYLWPESRGWVAHKFETEDAALDWLRNLEQSNSTDGITNITLN